MKTISLKKILKYFLPFGVVSLYRRLKTVPKNTYNSINWNLENLNKRGIKVNTIIDIGASNGSWTKNIINIFPDSNYFLIEANTYHKNELDNFIKKYNNVKYILAAAGDKIGEIYFNNSDPFGGLAMYEKPEGIFSTVPLVTIDQCIKNYELKGPFLLKLDTHGFEIQIFNGSIKMLKETNIIIVEAYNFKLTKDSLLFFEMCEYLKNYGFRCNGIIDILYRPKDNFLWQMDLIFIKDTREEFKDNNYL